MRLLDLLVKELPRRGGWPDGVAAMAQDANGAVQNYGDTDDIIIDSQHAFGTSRIKGSYSIAKDEVSAATDRLTSIITRAQYEAALAASKAAVGNNGWIQWAGGDCPVDSDAIVEVKYRNPNQYQFNSDRAGDFYWSHDGLGYDIIAYRPWLHSRANDDRLEQDLNECIGQDVDVVNHPSHYTKGSIECIDAIDSATTGKSGIEAVCVANVIKYLWRYEEKNGLEDVKKAKWYLNKLISELESN